MSYCYNDSLKGEVKERFKLKLDAVGLEECPYKIPAGAWKDDVTMWPPLQFGDLYTYLIKSPGKAAKLPIYILLLTEPFRWFHFIANLIVYAVSELIYDITKLFYKVFCVIYSGASELTLA